MLRTSRAAVALLCMLVLSACTAPGDVPGPAQVQPAPADGPTSPDPAPAPAEVSLYTLADLRAGKLEPSHTWQVSGLVAGLAAPSGQNDWYAAGGWLPDGRIYLVGAG